MENIENKDQNQTERDAQNAEEFRSVDPNENENIDQNERQNNAPVFTDYENKRLGTDPNRYSNFLNISESGSEQSANGGNFESPERFKEINSESIDENYPSEGQSHHSSRESRNDESDDSEDEIRSAEQDQQFFDGL